MATRVLEPLLTRTSSTSRAGLWITTRCCPASSMRAAGPLHYCPGSEYGPYWNVVAPRDRGVESRPELSHSWERGGISIGGSRPRGRRNPLPMFIAMDRPQHTGQRRAVAPAFTPAEWSACVTASRARTGTLLDSLPQGETFDWVDRVSVELTTQMLATPVRFPVGDRRLLPSERRRHRLRRQQVAPKPSRSATASCSRWSAYFQRPLERAARPRAWRRISSP
jgi:cytochrome P450